MGVRDAAPADIEAIRRVARRSWEADYPAILSRETAESGFDEWYAPAELEAELAHPRTVLAVAEAEGTVVGFVHAVTDDELGHVLRLYVDPEHRRAGFGRRLLDHVVDEMARLGIGRARALVLADNDLGIEFYRSAGFETVDEAQTTIDGTAYRELAMERAISR